jgi:hypothetical protein
MISSIQNKNNTSFGTLQIKNQSIRGWSSQLGKDLQTVGNLVEEPRGFNYNKPNWFNSELDCAQQLDTALRPVMSENNYTRSSFRDAEYLTAQPPTERKIKWALRKQGHNVKHITR